MKMQKTNLKIAGAFMLGALAATGGWLSLNQAVASNQETYRYLNLFGDVFDRVRSDYVEEPDSEKLIDTAINGMLTGLDPHSSYMNPKRFKDMQVQTRGEFGGWVSKSPWRTKSSRWLHRLTKRRPRRQAFSPTT
jgi:carboxyl-terminal processing protease